MNQETKLATPMGTIIAKVQPDERHPAMKLFLVSDDKLEKELFTAVEVRSDYPRDGVNSLRLLIYGDTSKHYTNVITLYEEKTKTVLDQVEESIAMAGYKVKRAIFCHTCGKQLNSWDLRCSKALAYRHPNCEACIAQEYDKTPDELRAFMEGWFGMRPCMGL